MASSEFYYEGDETTFINSDRLQRTLKFVPCRRNSRTSAGELLLALSQYGLGPQDVEGIYKVSALDNSYSIQLGFSDTVERVAALKSITAGDTKFDIMKLDEQVVSLRVHWLPLYYDNLLLNEILDSFGNVMSVNYLRTAHAECVTLDGVREVRLKTDELRKQRIPHVVHLSSGVTILITMPGRPPYCLKCKSVGHTRQKCPKNRFSNVVRQQTHAPSSDSTPAPTPTPVAEETVAPPDEPSGSTGGPTESNNEDDSSVKGDSGQEAMDSLSATTKRHLELEAEDPDFIRPNRPVRPRVVGDQRPLNVSNSFVSISSYMDP